jgi:hypothetical protein
MVLNVGKYSTIMQLRNGTTTTMSIVEKYRGDLTTMTTELRDTYNITDRIARMIQLYLYISDNFDLMKYEKSVELLHKNIHASAQTIMAELGPNALKYGKTYPEIIPALHTLSGILLRLIAKM